MHSLIKIEKEKAKDIIQTYPYDTILGFLFDMTRGNQLENEREIKQEGTKLDLIILGIDENLFEKLPEKG